MCSTTRQTRGRPPSSRRPPRAAREGALCAAAGSRPLPPCTLVRQHCSRRHCAVCAKKMNENRR
jgi:hypothetical protein